MKHVGLNVAADPLFTIAYTGVNAGLIIGVADDPAMHSSQNEQDSRHYAERGEGADAGAVRLRRSAATLPSWLIELSEALSIRRCCLQHVHAGLRIRRAPSSYGERARTPQLPAI